MTALAVGDRVQRLDGLHALIGTVTRVGGGPRGNIIRVRWDGAHAGIYRPETLHYADEVG